MAPRGLSGGVYLERRISIHERREFRMADEKGDPVFSAEMKEGRDGSLETHNYTGGGFDEKHGHIVVNEQGDELRARDTGDKKCRSTRPLGGRAALVRATNSRSLGLRLSRLWWSRGRLPAPKQCRCRSLNYSERTPRAVSEAYVRHSLLAYRGDHRVSIAPLLCPSLSRSVSPTGFM
jgi:hypothetical protein